MTWILKHFSWTVQNVYSNLVFQIVGKSHLWFLYSRMMEEGCIAKTYRRVSLLSVVSKVFEKLINNRIVDHLEKCGLFSDFQYGSRSCISSVDLLIFISDRIAMAFYRSGAVRAVALDISKAFIYLAFIYLGNLHKNIQLMLEFLKTPSWSNSFATIHLWPSWLCYL